MIAFKEYLNEAKQSLYYVKYIEYIYNKKYTSYLQYNKSKNTCRKVYDISDATAMTKKEWELPVQQFLYNNPAIKDEKPSKIQYVKETRDTSISLYFEKHNYPGKHTISQIKTDFKKLNIL